MAEKVSRDIIHLGRKAAVNTHSNARFAREVEGNVSGTATFRGAVSPETALLSLFTARIFQEMLGARPPSPWEERRHLGAIATLSRGRQEHDLCSNTRLPTPWRSST